MRALLRSRGLAHPLIPRDRAVSNDLPLDHDLQLMIVSGPNMAGKSTFLRGIGVNAVLAQSGAPVRAIHPEAFAVGSHRLHLRSGFARGRHLALLC